VLSGGATRQVDQVSDAEAFAYFAQLRAGGRKETSQQPIAAKPLHSVVLVLSATSQLLEDPGQIRRDRGLSLAKEAPRVIDQLDTTPEGKTLDHTFPGRIQPAAMLDRTKPQRRFQTCRAVRTGNAAPLGRLELGGRAVRVQRLGIGGSSRELVEKEIKGGNPAVPDNDEISPGVSWRPTRAARYPLDPSAVAQFLGLCSRLISKVRVSCPDRARDVIDLVAATVGPTAGIVEHGIFGEDLID
jgi:hypothetical protein